MEQLSIDDPRVKKHRERVLGKTALLDASTEYYDNLMVVEMGISLLEWRAYPLHDRAKIIACQHLKNMLAVVDAHYEALDDTMKKITEKGEGERSYG